MQINVPMRRTHSYNNNKLMTASLYLSSNTADNWSLNDVAICRVANITEHDISLHIKVDI
jgi:hypothetical protein